MAENEVRNRKSKMEKAEGDRETAEANAHRSEHQARAGEDEDAGGITNRPLNEEIENQDAVPERGQRKDDPVMPADDSSLKTKI